MIDDEPDPLDGTTMLPGLGEEETPAGFDAVVMLTGPAKPFRLATWRLMAEEALARALRVEELSVMLKSTIFTMTEVE